MRPNSSPASPAFATYFKVPFTTSIDVADVFGAWFDMPFRALTGDAL